MDRTDRTSDLRETFTSVTSQAREYLATPAGTRARRWVAAGLYLAGPLLFRLPGLRRYPVIRALEFIGGAALIVALAERLRDWQPVQATASGNGSSSTVVVDGRRRLPTWRR